MAQPALRGAPGGFPRRQPNYLYVLGGDGLFHSMYVSNGEEPQPGVKFIGPNANAQGLIVADGTAYVATTGNCGGVTDGVWALNLESKQVANWAGKVAGSAGPVLGPDGTVYVSTTSGDLVALEGKTLKVKEVYQAKQELTTSPVLFEYKDKTIAAAAAKDGSIHLVDVAKMASPSPSRRCLRQRREPRRLGRTPPAPAGSSSPPQARLPPGKSPSRTARPRSRRAGPRETSPRRPPR